MKMTLIGNPYSTFVCGFYGLVGLPWVISIKDWAGALFAGLFILAALVLTLYLIAIRLENNFFGKNANPLFVVDWGEDGAEMWKYIPEPLQSQIILCPARAMDQEYEWIISKLEESGNQAWCLPAEGVPQLPVVKIDFREGKYINETQKKYRKRAVKRMEAIKENWHDILFPIDDQERDKIDAPENADIKADWYRDTFLRSHENGSSIF